jgi:hypothetical protein
MKLRFTPRAARDLADYVRERKRAGGPAMRSTGLKLSVIARSEATKQSIYPRVEAWIASLRSQ